MQVNKTSQEDQLLQWFREHGGLLHERIQLVYVSEFGYHYVATGGPIKAKETICYCPFGLTLSHLNVMQDVPAGVVNCSKTSACSRMLRNLEIERSTIAIFFLVEQLLKARDSFWFPYIQLLPDASAMTTPLWFGDHELAYIRGTNLLCNDTPIGQTSIGLLQERYRKQWELGVQELKFQGEAPERFNWDLFRWGATIFSSRAFTSRLFTTTEKGGAAFPILYPALDIFNHRLGEKVIWQFEGGSFTLSLQDAVQQSKQVFNNYSPKGNEDLLMGFGFCISDNPYDRVAVRLGEVEPKVYAALHENIPSHWRSDHWDPEESVFYLPTMPGDEGDRACTYDVPELDCLSKIPRALVKSIHVIVDACAKNASFSDASVKEKEIWAGAIDLLLTHMKQALQGIRKWDGELPECALTPAAKAASMYREGQVNILQSVVTDLQAFMNPLYNGSMRVQDLF